MAAESWDDCGVEISRWKRDVRAAGRGGTSKIYGGAGVDETGHECDIPYQRVQDTGGCSTALPQ